MSLSPEKLAKVTDALKETLTGISADFAGDEDIGLVKLHVVVLESLLRVNTLPLFFGEFGAKPVDYEKNIVSLVSEIVLDKDRVNIERKIAALVLKSYKGRGVADALMKTARDQAVTELAAAKDLDTRELIQFLVDTLK
jgi:GNAT superfamily N-acetyltransferase